VWPAFAAAGDDKAWRRDLSNDGLEQEFRVFNALEGYMCTMCAPGNQEKSIEGKRGRTLYSALAAYDLLLMPTLPNDNRQYVIKI
jgi:hypothetical protein